MPLEYVGQKKAAEFFALLFQADRRYQLLSTRANGQPAFAAYLQVPHGPLSATGLFVIALAGGRISAMTRFDSTLFEWFGLPAIRS